MKSIILSINPIIADNLEIILKWILADNYSGHSLDKANSTVKIYSSPEIDESKVNTMKEILQGDGNLPILQYEKVRTRIKEAIAFANELILDFATENTVLRITELGLTSHVVKLTTPILAALQTGAFHVAIDELRKIPESELDEQILTPDRLRRFRNRIEQFLGLNELSLEWNE